MSTFQRPPRHLSPTEFFESWLPGQYADVVARARAARPGATPADLTAAIVLDGDGGGAWTLAVKGGALTVSPGAPGKADVSMRQSVADWAALVHGEDGAPQVAPPGGDPLAMLANTNPALAEALRGLRGTLRLEMPGFAGRTWSLQITFNGAAAPEAVISVDAQTAIDIQSGALPAPQAFFSGKIQMGGDTAFAMQVGMTLMAQLGG